MKPDELRCGASVSFEVRPLGGSFDPAPRARAEVDLRLASDEILLRWRDHVWPVAGIDPRRHEALVAAVRSGLPLICWLARADAARAVVQVHRFTAALSFDEPMALGVDDRILEDLRRRFGVGGTTLDATRWLEEELLIEGGGPAMPPRAEQDRPYRRAVVTGGPQGSREAFRVIGRRAVADIKRDGDRLQVERIVTSAQTDTAPLRLLRAPLSFVDTSAAGEIAAGARYALEQAVQAADSYLRIWDTYDAMEREVILRRARRVGTLAYERCEQRRDGGWRFHLAVVEDLEDRLAALGESDRLELEAGEGPPRWESLDEHTRRDRGQRRLAAPLLGVNGDRKLLDLRAPDDEEDQPPPPARGFLYMSLVGDRTRLQRREEAERRLRTGACPMPQLGLLMEGRPAPQARYRRRNPMSDAVLRAFGGRPTQRQLEALDVALNTPDIALIQGPPGTGKTKVITALQRRIAELAEEGAEVSHRVLVTSAQHDAVENVVQRSEVFGLPAVKIGARRGGDGGLDSVEKFRADRIERLRATLRDPPEAERAARARRIAVSCLRAPAPAGETARQLGELAEIAADLIPPALRDRLHRRVAELSRPAAADGDPEEQELRLAAARGIRVAAAAFTDDGPARARKALARLDDMLQPAEREFLRESAAWSVSEAPPWLSRGEALRDAILDRLTAPAPAALPAVDEQTHALLVDTIDAIEQRRMRLVHGEEAVLAAYLEDLDGDPGAVRDALEHYTVVLAATCQQAASRPMQVVRGIEVGSVSFETIIVDEAARVEPLDLFIPLSMARRRAVLVGDHRQLPHMLEPDVEQELASAVESGDITREAQAKVKESLFQRLWVLLKQLEARDEIPRTVTLDTQFRMHPALGAYVSRVFYERRGDARIASARGTGDFAHELPGYQKDGRPCAAAWIDVPGGPGRQEWRTRSKSREAEAKRVACEVRALIEAAPQLTFGIIAFYTAQVDAIFAALAGEGLAERTGAGAWRVAERWRRTEDHRGQIVERLRVGTVDAFQGKEFDVVFLSITRSNDLPGETEEQRRRKYGHLLLENRLCVAMSRQQRLLVVAGDLAFVQAAEPLEPLREFLKLCKGPHGIVHA